MLGFQLTRQQRPRNRTENGQRLFLISSDTLKAAELSKEGLHVAPFPRVPIIIICNRENYNTLGNI